MISFASKLAFVTGASEGIGKEVARAFYAAGAKVVLVSRSADKLARAVADICGEAADDRLVPAAIDLRDWAAVKKGLEGLAAAHGTPDYLINCAGYARPGYIDQLDVEHCRGMMDTNFFGVLHACKALVPAMAAAGKGRHIVNVSSMGGFIGLFGYTGYCATKFAVFGFTEALRRELVHTGVRVSVLCPPNTNTPGLAEENKTKPAEVLATEEKVKPLEPAVIAAYLLKRIGTKKFALVPSFDGALAFFLSRKFPGILSQFVKRPAPARK